MLRERKHFQGFILQSEEIIFLVHQIIKLILPFFEAQATQLLEITHTSNSLIQCLCNCLLSILISSRAHIHAHRTMDSVQSSDL